MNESWPGDLVVSNNATVTTSSAAEPQSSSSPPSKVIVQTNENDDGIENQTQQVQLDFVSIENEHHQNSSQGHELQYQVVLASDPDDENENHHRNVVAEATILPVATNVPGIGTKMIGNEEEFMVWDASSIGELLKNGNIQITIEDQNSQEEMTTATRPDEISPTTTVVHSPTTAHDTHDQILITATTTSEPALCHEKVTVNSSSSLGINLKSDPIKSAIDIKQLMNAFIYECSMCTFSFRTEQELSLHIYAFHKMTSFNCAYCDYVTQDIEQYRKHELLHDGSIPGPKFLCSQCMESFDTEDGLKSHSKFKHNSVHCPICQILLANRYL